MLEKQNILRQVRVHGKAIDETFLKKFEIIILLCPDVNCKAIKFKELSFMRTMLRCDVVKVELSFKQT